MTPRLTPGIKSCPKRATLALRRLRAAIAAAATALPALSAVPGAAVLPAPASMATAAATSVASVGATGGALAAALLAQAALAPRAHAQSAGDNVPQPTLPRVQLNAGIHLIRAEVAADFGTRARGLMFRERLGPNEGMLFVFERHDRHCFWMRNTPLPLSIAFLDDDGTIVNIENMQPRSDDSHCPAKPVRYALEMEQGWFGKRGLASGARIGGLPR